jgi:hypothetical protein
LFAIVFGKQGNVDGCIESAEGRIHDTSHLFLAVAIKIFRRLWKSLTYETSIRWVVTLVDAFGNKSEEAIRIFSGRFHRID